MQYELNLSTLEIAITYVCNVKCNNCCTLCTQAPVSAEENMTPALIKNLIDESVQEHYPWKWIKLHGGEPTLHRNFREICLLLSSYKKGHNPECELSVCSNGNRSELVESVRELGFSPQVSVKVEQNKDVHGNPIPYTRVNESPSDLGLLPASCYIPKSCGICLNNLGFWPCSPVAAAARVFNYETPCKHVKDICIEKLSSVLHHCNHCGFSAGSPRSIEQVTTETWSKRLKNYNAPH